MALTPTDYTLLFTHIGEFVQRTNDFTTLYTDLDSDFTEINDALYSAVAADDRADITSGLPESFDSFKSSVEGWISIMTSKSTDLLTRLNSVLEKLPLAGATDVQSVLTEIIRDMNASVPPQTVEDSAITVGAIGISVPTTNARETGTAQAATATTVTLATTASSVNGFYLNQELKLTDGAAIGETEVITSYVGSTRVATTAAWASSPGGETPTYEISGIDSTQVLISTVLDGDSAPTNGALANPEYTGLTSELAPILDNMVFECTTDSVTVGVSEGSEEFSWAGDVKAASPFNWEATAAKEGGGVGPSLTVLNSNSLLANLEFEDFAVADTPDSWTIDSGNVGDEITEETVATEVHRGSSALAFTGDAATTDPLEISQAPAANTFTPLKQYCVAVWVKGDSAVAAGALTIQFEGTGYTAGATEKITMTAGNLAAQTSYGIEHFFVNMPADIPSDFKLVIRIDGVLTNTAVVRFDGMAVGPVVYHDGVGAAILAGKEKFLVRDKFTSQVTNDNAGTFQTFFRRAFLVQLPSSTSATIPDTLAE